MRSLWDRVRGRRSPITPRTVTVYSRPGCGCCQKAIGVLEVFQARHPIRIEVVDVDGSEELKVRYGMEVPVVVVDGRVRFRGSVNPALLERLLQAGAGGDGPEGG